jgi:nitrate/nitrite transporter NarK
MRSSGSRQVNTLPAAISSGQSRRVSRLFGLAALELVGSISRPIGGLIADKIGGAKVTFWNFIAMGAATLGVMYFVDHKEFVGFLAMFRSRFLF